MWMLINGLLFIVNDVRLIRVCMIWLWSYIVDRYIVMGIVKYKFNWVFEYCKLSYIIWIDFDYLGLILFCLFFKIYMNYEF